MAKASWILLLVVALAATVSTARALDSLPFIEMPLYVGDQRTALGIYEGDNVNAAVEKFGVTHALSPDELTTLKAEVTRRFLSIAQAVNGAPPAAAAAKEPLFEIPVGLQDGRVVPLRLFEGDNLVRAVRQFAKEQNIPEDVIPALFEEVKKRVVPADPDAKPSGGDGDAALSTPEIIFDIPIDVDGDVHYLKLYRGDVLGDRVKAFAVEHKLTDALAQKMLEVGVCPIRPHAVRTTFAY